MQTFTAYHFPVQLKIKVAVFKAKTHDQEHAYTALLMLGFKEVVRVPLLPAITSTP